MNFQVLIAEDEDGGTGVGNLCIKSPGMFSEYWNLPEVQIHAAFIGGQDFFQHSNITKWKF